LAIGCTTGCTTRYYNAMLTPINQCLRSVSRCYNRLYVLLHAVVKVVLWSRGAHLTKPGWNNPHTHSNPTNMALFRHKITLYRFNQGGSYYCRGAQMGAGGGRAPFPPHFNHCYMYQTCLIHATRNSNMQHGNKCIQRCNRCYNAVIASFDDWWPGLLRRCSARLEQLAIHRHCVTDTRHRQAPAEDTSFRCFPYLTHLVLNLRCAVIFVTLTDVQCSWSFFLLNDTLIILV